MSGGANAFLFLFVFFLFFFRPPCAMNSIPGSTLYRSRYFMAASRALYYLDICSSDVLSAIIVVAPVPVSATRDRSGGEFSLSRDLVIVRIG